MAADVKGAKKTLKIYLEEKAITQDFYSAATKMLSVLEDIENQANNLEKEMPKDQSSSNYPLKMRKYHFIKDLYEQIMSDLFNEKEKIVPSKNLIGHYKDRIVNTVAKKNNVSAETIWSDVNKGGSFLFNTGRTGSRYQELIRIAPEETVCNEAPAGIGGRVQFGYNR